MAEWRRFGLAALAYAALALLLVRGLFGQFSTAVPHDAGDPLLSTWILWWNAHHVPFVGRWWDGLGFFPLRGSLAFSDHRVGLELIAGPVQWLGATPVLAYNLTFMSCFVLSALGAHALTWTLTKSHAAAAVSGVAFGFNPYRMAHLAHLELQAAYCLPFALLALHQYVGTWRPRWLVTFAVLLAFQGLCSGYYLFFSIPLIALWFLWFARDVSRARQAALLAAWASAFVVLLPVLLEYRALHAQTGFGRAFGEMQDFSADVTGLLSAQPLMLWRVPSLALNPEGDVYLGVIAPLLILAAIIWNRPAVKLQSGRARWPELRLLLAIVGAVFLLVAVTTVRGPWTIRFGPMAISANTADKPLTVVFVAGMILFLTSVAWARIWGRRSTLAFYLTGAILSWLFALGPAPRILGRSLLYRGPYALLMLLPGFESGFRAPARFIMISALCVAVAAGLAVARMIAARPRMVRAAIGAGAVALLAADGWPADVGSAPVPLPLEIPAAQQGAVIELPLGETFADIAAVYRSTSHGLPVVNGYSGFDPPAYQILRLALTRRDESVLPVLASFSPLLARVDRASTESAACEAYVRAAGAAVVGSNDRELLFRLAQRPVDRPEGGRMVPIRSVRTMPSGQALPIVARADGSAGTRWRTSAAQQFGDELVVELDGQHAVRELDLGALETLEFPGALLIETSVDGREWIQQWKSGAGGAAFLAALEAPRSPVLRFPVGDADARWLRIRQLWNDSARRWSVASLAVRERPATPQR